MARAKKLPSGNWRTRVYAYTDENNKKHYKSFTASTKKESERLATQYEYSQNLTDMTVFDSINNYIRIKEKTLSPSTIKGYSVHLNNHVDDIKHYKLSALTSAIIQDWIGNLNTRLSPKTVCDTYHLLVATMKFFDYSVNFKIKLPQKRFAVGYIPTSDDISRLLEYLKQKNYELAKAVALAAFGTLRRSEICALTSDDVHGNEIIINKALLYIDGKNIIKDVPKNESSNRTVVFAQFVIDMLPSKGKLVNLSPNQITQNLRFALIKLNIPLFRFHDLRHYSASIMHAKGIPDVYIMERGGWESDATLKKIYRNSLDDFSKKYTDEINNYFSNL